MPAALGLIIVGTLFLLSNLNIIHGGVWRFVWPIIIIMIGASMITKRTGK